MKRIAVMGCGDESAAANLIGTMLTEAAGWRVEVTDHPNRPEETFRQLEREGWDCAVAALSPTASLCHAQIGVLTGAGGGQTTLPGRCDRLVLNLDDPDCRRLAEGWRTTGLTYSERRDSADLTAKNLRLSSQWMEFVALTWGDIHRVRMPAWGGYDLYQGLAALGCGLSLGLELGTLASSVEHPPALPGRMEPFPMPDSSYRVILDRAVTLAQLEGLLLSLQGLRTGTGNLRLVLPQPKPETLALCRELAEEVITEPDPYRAICQLLQRGRPGDVLVITGVHQPGDRNDERRLLRRWQREQQNKNEKL